MAKKYKAADLCRSLEIQPYVLRYWETEFPSLRDQMLGRSTYSEEALEIARRIKELLYDEGYTIVGAKKKLAGPKPEVVQTVLPTEVVDESVDEAPSSEVDEAGLDGDDALEEGASEPEAEGEDASEESGDDSEGDAGLEEPPEETDLDGPMSLGDEEEPTSGGVAAEEIVLSDLGGAQVAEDHVEERVEPPSDEVDPTEVEAEGEVDDSEEVDEPVSESPVLDTPEDDRIKRVARRAAALRDLAADLLSDLEGDDDR